MESGDEDEDLRTAAGGPAARGADTIIDAPSEWDAIGARDRSDTGMVDVRPRALSARTFDERYERRRRLGQGGMGDVHLCFDSQIGRDVAIKVMIEETARHPTWRKRFLREARVQAQLEHPGVVPVHEIGETPEGQTYFAMKRVQGQTLSAVIRGLREGDEALLERYPRSARLEVFARICETIAYAHARGVVHRDLKPPNVMLGDFGEVSVLDWGLAKLDSESDLSGSEPGLDDEGDDDFTRPGSVIGSPGYMSPEQATGDPVGPPTDVYSLGVILHELVTLTPLHEGDRDERLRSTIRGADARPSAKVDDVPEALDAICARAAHPLADERYPDAKALLADVRAFLSGQRVTELRREVADQHAMAARRSLGSGSATETMRVAALRDLGAAAVLNPDDREMVEMIEALLDPGDELPAPVERELEEQRARAASQAAGRSAIAYLAALVVLPLLHWMGVRSELAFGLVGLGILGASLGAFVMWRTGRSTGPVVYAAAPLSLLLVGTLATIFGPFFLVPALAVMVSVAFTVSVRAPMGQRRLILICACLSVLLPFGLAELGVIPASIAFEEGRLVILPVMASFPPLPTTALLLVTSIFVIVASNVLVGRAVEALRVAERRQRVQAHRLRALLPGAPRASAGARSA